MSRPLPHSLRSLFSSSKSKRPKGRELVTAVARCVAESLEDRRLFAATVLSQNFDAVIAPALPAGWSTSTLAGTANLWQTSVTSPSSSPNAAATGDPSTVSDNVLVTPSFALPASPFQGQVTFRNSYAVESSFDGMRLEISINGGAFQDIVAAGGSFVTGGYNGASVGFGNPLGSGTPYWTGNSGGYVTTTANLPLAANGQPNVLQWRMTTDSSVSSVGVSIDDVVVTAPTLAVSGVTLNVSPAAIVEGAVATATGSFTDDTNEVHSVVINWQDGATTTTALAAGANAYTVTHSYLDDNPTGTVLDVNTVTATVSDPFGTSASATATIQVSNVVPSGLTVAPTATSLNEGQTLTLTGTFADPGLGDVHTVHVNWADGTAAQDVVLPTGTRAFTITHVYADDNPTGTPSDVNILTATVTDDDGGSTGIASSNVTVNNLAPANVTVAATTFTEGTPGTLTGSFTDAGVLDTHTVVVNFNDATAPVTQTLAAGVTTFTAVHTFLDDGASPGNSTPSDLQSVSVTVTDDDTGTAAGGGNVTVANSAPAFTSALQTPIVIPENGTTSVTAAFTDLGVADAHVAVVSWGDATFTTLSLAAGVTTFVATHQYLDDGPYGALPGNGTPSDAYPIVLTVTDDDTGTDNFTIVPVTVNNVAPSAVTLAATTATVNEGSAATFTGSFTDPGTKDFHFVTLNWADGSADSVVTLAPGVTTFTATHAFLDDGASPGNGTPSDVYTVSATVSDDDTGVAAAVTAPITVNNVAPSALVLTAPAAVNEMQAFTLSGTFADPGTLDVHTVTINWADASPAQTLTLAAGVTTFSATHTYVDDNPGTGPADVNTIAVTVADDDLGSVAGTKGVQVKNVAPAAQNTGDATGVPGQLRTVTVGATDVSPVDQAAGFRWTIDFGDGTPVQVIANGTSPTAVQHAWAKTGTFTITVRATDKDLGTSVAAKRTIVIKQVDLQADPCDPNLTALVVGDTSGSNKIEFLPAAGGKVQVKVNGAGKGAFLFDGRIVAYGNDGNDTISVSTAITKSAWIFAGKGNDTVNGGSGDDFVDGGRGNDKIYGRDGRDVLVGGGDTDTVVGGNGDDVLVAALSLVTTPAAYNEQICAVMDEWTSGSSYADRVDHLVNGDGLNGSVRLAPDTVSSDPKAADTLIGGADQDLFYLNPATVGTSKDKIIDLMAGEIRVFVGDVIP